MTSSVSVVRAWERHVSHTSSPIFTEVSDISAAADRGRRRSAGVWRRRWTGGCGALLSSEVEPLFLWELGTAAPASRRRRWRGVCVCGVFRCGVGPRTRCPLWWGSHGSKASAAADRD
jgi:hypothetical protein